MIELNHCPCNPPPAYTRVERTITGNRKGIIYAALERLDERMAIGESRYALKKARRAAGEKIWSFSDGLIHSYGTRTIYQQLVLAFISWARETYEIRRLELLESRAEELTTCYLLERLHEGYSPYTLQTTRSALRLFFANRSLAEEVIIPPRRREMIKRGRGIAKRDSEFQPANWQRLIRFLQATGLRRSEVRLLRVEDLQETEDGRVEVVIKPGHGKGGRPRLVPVLAGYEQEILALGKGRDPAELFFAQIPSRVKPHTFRREYAQAYYRALSGRELPPATGVLSNSDYDEAAVLQVSRALGHNRKDVILRHYLR